MKKKLFLVVLLTLALSVFSACGTDEPAGDGGTEPQNGAGVNDDANITEPAASTYEAIMNTFSAKEFKAEQVESSTVEKILLAGAKAPSARNQQPWHFTVVQDYELVSQMTPQAEEGSVVIVVSGQTEEMEGVNVDFDCGLATENMYVTAQSLGLGAHIYTGPVNAVNGTMKEDLEIPEGYDAVSILLIGHVESIEDGISGATERNPLSDIVNYIE